MTFESHLEITVQPGTRDAAIKAFIARRVFEECAEAIPGFLGARLLEAQDASDTLVVVSQWQSAADQGAWVAHPVRAQQVADMARFLAGPPQTKLFRQRG